MEKISSILESGSQEKQIRKEFICSKCNTSYIQVYDTKEQYLYTVPCKCGFERELNQHSIEATNRATKIDSVELNKRLCGFTKEDLKELNNKIILNSANKAAYNDLIKFANTFNEDTKKGVYIGGTPGVGKTSLARKTAAIVLNRGYSVYFTKVTKLLNDIKARYDDRSRFDVMRYACICDLLILDDLGMERPTPDNLDKLGEIIDFRGVWKPTLYTSNMSIDELKQKYDKYGRIYSRILGSCDKVYWIEDIDHRKENVDFIGFNDDIEI